MNKKIRFTLEVEYQNDGLTDDFIREAWKRYSDYEKMIEDKESWEIIEHSKHLLEVVLSDEVLLTKYLKFMIMSEIEMLDFRSLQKIFETHDQDEQTVLLEAIKKLNYVDRAFFAHVVDNGVFSEHTEELRDSFKIVSQRIDIEEII